MRTVTLSVETREDVSRRALAAFAGIPTEEIIKYVQNVEDESSEEVMPKRHMERLAKTWEEEDIPEEEEQSTPVAPRRKVLSSNGTVNGINGAGNGDVNGAGKIMDVPAFFPVPQPPKLEALEEKADKEIVIEEMSRLLNDLVGGLRVARKVLNSQKTRRAKA